MELAKVMCDVSVLPSLVSPLQEVEEPSPPNASNYAAPAVPELETILESPGYTVPGGTRLFVGARICASARGGLRGGGEFPAVITRTTSATYHGINRRPDGNRCHPTDCAADPGPAGGFAGYEGIPLRDRVYGDERN